MLLAAAAGIHGQQNGITVLHGNRRPAGALVNESGRVDANFPLPAMTLFLKLSSSQQAELQQLLDAQRDPASPQYHQWLTPDEFADRFGANPADISAATVWLRGRGFTVRKISRSRRWIVFGGTAKQVESAFHTEIHRYILAGKTHFANATEPSIPSALADFVSGIEGLDDFFPGDPTEMTSAGGVHTLAPDDLAVIYNIASVYKSGIDGTGQKIAVAGTSRFDASALADVAAFRTKFNLPANVPQVVLNPDYPDPGVTASLNEAHLDIEWAGAIGRNAQIIFVYSNTFLHAVLYAVDNNLAPVITMSANNGCEQVNTVATMTFYRQLAQQANAQGITWVNSGSDAGPASCDPNGAPIAAGGLGVRFPASIPEITAVGGTEFNEQGGAYWNATNTANGASAASYIPEMVWNDAVALGALWAGGGGTSIFFPKPAWQAGPGVPNDNARDVPDIALAASFNHDGYYVIRNGAVVTTGGTSASAPVFAGMLALLNQYVVTNGIQPQPGLGNVNPALYRLAASGSGVFHDITVGNNIVPCQKGSLNCLDGSFGFSAGPGYDLASGLGSIDVGNLLTNWTSVPPPPKGPSILSGGIINAASYAAPLAPGALVAIFTSPLDTQAAGFSGNSLPSSLSGVSVTFNHVTAPMVSVSPAGPNPYVSVQVPFEALPTGQTSGTSPAVIYVNGAASVPVVTSIVPSAPGIFTIPPTGQGNAILAFIDPNTNQVSIAAPRNAAIGYPAVPIPRGTAGFFYVTGLGAMSPAVADGSGNCTASDGLCHATAMPAVFVGGIQAEVPFAGQAPGFPGVFQVNIVIPAAASPGDAVPLVIKSADGSVTSNTATIAVQ